MTPLKRLTAINKEGFENAKCNSPKQHYKKSPTPERVKNTFAMLSTID